MTKAEERKVLAEIKKLVEKAGGERSYIGTALDGALDLAEQNIEEDAAYSCKFYMEKYYNREADARKAKEAADREIKEANEDAAEWRKAADTLKGNWREALADAEKNRQEAEAARRQVEALELEVMKLKARLYDFMTK